MTDFIARHRAVLLAALISAALLLRALVIWVVPQPVASDAFAYFEMAKSLSTGEPMRDNFGQIAFYSAGYPLLLGMVFAITVRSVATALVINLLLAGCTALLVDRLALRLGAGAVVRLLAVAAYTVWPPSWLSCASLAKENLTTPLFLGFVLMLVALTRNKHILRSAAAAGLAFGAGLIAGASTLFAGAAVLPALWRISNPSAAALAFGLATTLVLAPWLTHTARHVGTPVLTTNGGFNLYLGNNPAATGTFVSISDTPAGPRWETMRTTLGEAGSASALGREATDYAYSHPMRTAALATFKLASFWAPNIPDTQDRVTGPMAAVRWADVVQHLLILGLALVGGWSLRHDPVLPVVVTAIGGLWIVHAATYVMVRYREPAMPIMIVLAAIGLASLFPKRVRA